MNAHSAQGIAIGDNLTAYSVFQAGVFGLQDRTDIWMNTSVQIRRMMIQIHYSYLKWRNIKLMLYSDTNSLRLDFDRWTEHLAVSFYNEQKMRQVGRGFY
jgi:hypothetical protein